ncbi:carcinoembryonic antigen-related cell adhesion molecule 5-like isoform X2 [Gadus chalcogrammus]|nr:carcinoembryonic antigen-related cell adhesion molecule 5-like isoform X2 [Gadus chalcogrammus]XP_056440211.1 carcinoembryonic antigen-related cell adhesion molecule 5-like isoform X2 [Gadus chalcogrammus]XP_056440212.1 carcinoembryonic antigen-related cell adhesion molecule 5-like isoform X2 [Gadus chalcogrammus]
MRFTRYITMIKLEMLLNVIFVSGDEESCTAALNASMPNKMEALSDTCLQIPCSFDSVPSNKIDKNKNILGAWIKSDHSFDGRPENVVFHSNNQDNKYPISIIGNMTEYNCTTVFTNIITSYADVYYFRVESTGFRATDICNPLTITVKDSAPAPSIQTVQEGPLTEGSRVTFTCRAIAPCPTQPPHLSWNQSGGPEGRLEPHGDQEPNVRTRRLNITLSDRHDGVRLTCLAEYPVNVPAGGPSIRTAESVVTLNVSYSPKDTQASVSPPTVSLGSVVNLTCTSRANPPVLRFTWFRSSAEGPLNVSDGSLYSFNVSSYREIYYCVATNPLGNQTSKEITLTVSGESGLNVPLIVGGFFGTVFFIGLMICVLWLLKKPSTQQQLVCGGLSGADWLLCITKVGATHWWWLARSPPSLIQYSRRQTSRWKRRSTTERSTLPSEVLCRTRCSPRGRSRPQSTLRSLLNRLRTHRSGLNWRGAE